MVSRGDVLAGPARRLIAALVVLAGAGFLAKGPNVCAQSTWIKRGLSGLYVQALSVAPSDSSVIYAAAIYGGGVFRSSDGGNTWVDISGATYSLGAVFAIAVSPLDSSVVYAGTSGSGILKTVDGGQSWSPLTLGSANGNNVEAIAIDPTAPSTLYAGSGTGWIFKSTNGGTSWTSAMVANSAITSIAVDAQRPSTLYASAGGDGVFWSNDGGVTWQGGYLSVLTGPLGASAVRIDPSDPSVLYCDSDQAVYISRDRAQSWTSVFSLSSTGATLTSAMLIVPGASSTVFVGCSYGLWMGTSGGTSWQRLDTGMAGKAVFSLASDGHTWSTLYAGTLDGVWSLALSSGQGHSISGTVTLNGVGLEGVMIMGAGQPTTTGADGRYSLTGLSDGTYYVSPSLSAYAFTPRSRTISVSGGDVGNADFAATPVVPPVISSVAAAASPFRIKIMGTGFQSDAKVWLGSSITPWGTVVYKNPGLLVLKGGAALKACFPKGTSVLIIVVNGDGGGGTFIFRR